MLKKKLNEISINQYDKEFDKLTKQQIYDTLLIFTKEQIEKLPKNKGERKLYYVSAEFLIGKLLSNNLINLGLYDQVNALLKEINLDMSQIEEIENEPSLGNGGLGRLAACFLDSIATLGLNGDGIGINYHLGLFKQKFIDNKQFEEPNNWIRKNGFLKDTGEKFDVKFGDCKVTAHMYDIAVTGYESGYNNLHLFDIDTVDENIVRNGISFDKTDIKRNLTLFLYPDDSDKNGQLLRIYQQYFMVSAGAQLILKELQENGHKIEDLHKYVAIQINDTHPTLIIPELIRLLTEKGIDFDEAVDIVTKTVNYTNHTILAEALEKWPYEYLKQVVPHLMLIIEKLNTTIKERFKSKKVQIIDKEHKVHMAHIAIHFSSSTNGVAKLHTDILKKEELKAFYEIYPEKFNNKTNGITFRRWLLNCNEELTDFITSLIGEGFKKDARELEKLSQFVDDEQVLDKLLEIKKHHKQELSDYIKLHENIEIDSNSIYDIQIKRLHEYKRQQMNALYIIDKYLDIKKGRLPKHPITVIFGAKAAPAYTIAKDIIHLILTLSELIEKDEKVSKYLKVVMVQNYNVSYAQKLIPACDISEQISLASKEASGTGNMKLMLNGAVTLGTMDGANVEIAELVGQDNIYIFGKTSKQVINLYKKSSYDTKKYYQDDECIKEIVDFIISDKLMELGDKTSLTRLHQDISQKDYFMALLDLRAYIKTKNKMTKDYKDRHEWAKKMLINISKAGQFSSDRTIEEYNREIWHL
ncbi:phosphorylase, glycogen/starch/alpha-glucan family [Peptoanaerobacter stomatis]|uniref:Alpha-1,4 glucan phosphorylase n=1 Tax=Peptoanaerobacter stomatis TaxID=796937 RepID=J6HLX2_9FIRM|nr:glycogen/starch/alpha-glucan phosphorylase [Peptoanaerobacter stomatis]EJU23463.1 phosphorylase, glycogen/starch/alpha-glucan family [Peptoanaerobacter stomatis]NWO24396.1 glycogen/starch/alpha-glucan family phosphorylase [Peptostreptococcaceae bacterium oral taxon 081]